MPASPLSSHRGLHIVASDRPATLVERLALDLAAAPLAPFAIETIVVQSRGTERWIRHELARRHGCAASLGFPFAVSFFRALAFALVPERPDSASVSAPERASTIAENPFARDTLTWRILDLLESGIADEPELEAIRDFVGDAEHRDTRKLLGLAGTAAGRFEEYQLYRPDLLLAWESDAEPAAGMDADERWQRALWRRVRDASRDDDRLARLYVEAADLLHSAAERPAGLPDRLSVFGVNTLPPVFVRLLHAVARHVPVRVYLQAPRRETWSAARRGNPLWSSFGRVTRELASLLEQHAPADRPVVWEEHHRATQPTSILARLQSDVRDGIHRGPAVGLAAPVALAVELRDESLTVHRCHSPMREMEVLRDQLLAAFAADPTLRPHDVLLLLPDIDRYAPFVDAVFGVDEPGLPHVPHRIADRPIAQESRVADAALRLLRLVGARWTSAEIVALLDQPAVQRAARIEDAAMSRILRWIEETNIRWGRDGAMRREMFGLPAIDANTWRAGIDRLLMGYATGRSDELVDDILPHAGDTIGDPETLGAFAAFVDGLFETLSGWRSARPLAQWASELRRAFTTFLAAETEDEERELDVLLSAVDALATTEADAACGRAFELPVVRDWLEAELSDDSRSAGFLSGGMTVCALKPMRTVPHRIVAIAGLDDATFPRAHGRPAFDLISRARREGDRDRRADDRQLFADTIMATEERLILSYVANSATTNAERAASVVIAELLDVVDESFASPAGSRARDVVEVRHRLQPFAPEYFDGASTGSRLFSYSRVNARALERAAASAGASEVPFVDGPLPEDAGGAARDVRLEQLIDCWTNPSRFFCRRALQLTLPGDDKVLEECEPMTLDRLGEYTVQDRMLRRFLRGKGREAAERAEAIARGDLPSGALSGVWYDRLRSELAGLLASLGTPDFQEPLAITVRGATWTLLGRVDGITGSGRLQVRPAKCNAKDLIRAWITHLALTAAHGPVTTTLVGRDGRWTFGEVAEPLPLLDALVEGYRDALRQPPPFLTEASYAYAQQAMALERQAATGTGRATASPIDKARQAFAGSEFNEALPCDRTDPYVTLAWRGRDPFGDLARFDAASMGFWRPALACRTNGGAEVTA